MNEKKKDYFLFLTGLLGAFQFRYIGTFYCVELIAFFSYFFISWRIYKKSPMTRKFMNMSYLWLLGSIIANIWNGIETEPALKGIFNIVFFIAQIPFAYWALQDKISRWLYFYTGYAISTVLNFYFIRIHLVEEGDIDIWMFYAWTQLVVAISALFYYKGFHRISYLVAIGLGVYGLFNGSRNMFLTLSLASVILYFIDRIKGKDLLIRIKRFQSKALSLIITLVIGAFAIATSYERLASDGSLGEAAYEKYMIQKYTQMGIASGRGDFVLALEFMVRNPIIGYGSFAEDETGLRAKLSEKYDLASYDGKNSIKKDVVPCHSVLLGQWNWHGVLAGGFWLYYLFFIYKSFRNGIFLLDQSMMGLGVFVSVMLLWDIYFSPMGARTPFVFYFIYLIMLNSKYQLILATK